MTTKGAYYEKSLYPHLWMTLGLFSTSCLNRSFSQLFSLNWLNDAPPLTSFVKDVKGYVVDVFTVRLRLGSGSLGGRLGRRPSWLCESTIRLFVFGEFCPVEFAEFPGFNPRNLSDFRGGGGKIRQTLCVLNLAKILLKYLFLFLYRRRRKIYKRCFCLS